jgi:broad specificity phosphatase PhoE
VRQAINSLFVQIPPMGTLYLVRHGQASFGTDNYDQLSALGESQGHKLGAYFARKQIAFEAILSGTLMRHRQTHAAIQEGMGVLPQAVSLWPGLNEYDSQAIIAAMQPQALASPMTPEGYRQHFGLLRQGLTQWIMGQIQPQGMPNWPEFQDGVRQALDHVRLQCEGKVLLVSSGGPIATAISLVLRTPPDSTVELNMRLRNSAVTEFEFSSKRHSLLTFNSVAHLDDARLISYA